MLTIDNSLSSSCFYSADADTQMCDGTGEAVFDLVQEMPFQ
jgi:hypothetical protein